MHYTVSMNFKLTVTLPDGTKHSRTTPRNYTHAIVVSRTATTNASYEAKYRPQIEAAKAKLADLEQLAADPAEQERYRVAKAQRDYLDEPVTNSVTKLDGTIGEYQSARRYLAGMRAVSDAAYAAYNATARAKAEYVQLDIRNLEKALAWHLSEERNAFVHGWSQSAKGAEKQVAEAMKQMPYFKVTVITEIEKREVKPRAKKSAEAQ